MDAMRNIESTRELLADWTKKIPESEIRRLLKNKTKYYLAGGLPGNLPTKVFPKILEELSEYYEEDEKRVINEFQYGMTAGAKGLREVLAERLHTKDKISCISGKQDWEKMLITTGSQQATYLVLDILVNPGDIVITPSPAYLGFVTAVVKIGGTVVTAPTDELGLIPEFVEDTIVKAEKELGKKVKLLYVVSDSDNPKGTTLPYERRKALYDLAEKYNIFILEDEAYKEMQFTERIPPIKSLDKDNEWVIYVSSTSKEAAPLRIGYSLLPEHLHLEAEKSKGYIDLCTPTLTQRVAEIYYAKYIDSYLPEIVQKYKTQKDVAFKALQETFPEGDYTNPTGGFFIWWQAPGEKAYSFDIGKFNQDVLLPNDVLVVPGAAFYPPVGHSYDLETRTIIPLKIIKGGMRIGFSFLKPELLDEGVRKLGELLTKHV